MDLYTPSKIFAIRDTETGEFIKTKTGKVGWKRPSDAKSAFNLRNDQYFDDQTRFVVVELLASDKDKLDKIRSLIYQHYHTDNATTNSDILDNIKNVIEDA